MKHLSHAEVVDLIESSPTLSAGQVKHVERCERCRQEVETIRAMRLAASADPMPEPSPLFWDHFAARVAGQLRSEPAPAPLPRWSAAPSATWAVAGTVVVLLISMVVWRTTLHAPAPQVPKQQVSNQMSAPTELAIQPIDDVDDDAAWAVVRAAAADLAWEDAHEAGISAHPGDVENAALQLNAAERLELERLLDEEMKRNGA